MKKIVLASNNKGKVKEVKEILKDYEIVTLNDIEFYDDIIEDGETFLDNALIKARAIRKFLGDDTLIISDDSGLCCPALDGAPGVYSARYAGNHDDQKNRDKLIKDLEKLDKTAYFICEIVLLKEDGNYEAFEGRTYGKIISEEKGDNGFSYDCIFLSDDLGKTFAEATDEEKNSCSHRGRALEKLSLYLEGDMNATK